jgi:hypothetical protein
LPIMRRVSPRMFILPELYSACSWALVSNHPLAFDRDSCKQ